MIALRQVMSLDMLRIVMIGLRPSYNYKGNHIITLGVTQAHNGERDEPHNSKLRATKIKAALP
jgi:hypothetical protein